MEGPVQEGVDAQVHRRKLRFVSRAALAQSVATEALEEAGVTGELAADPIGRYHDLKERNGSALPCAEKEKRQKLWLRAERAAAKVAEPGWRRLLTDFARARKAA